MSKLFVAFFPSKVNDRLNGKPWEPDRWVGRCMVNPAYARRCRLVLPEAETVIDSQAFQQAAARAKYERAVRLKKKKLPPKPLEAAAAAAAQHQYWKSLGIRPAAVVHFDDVVGVDEEMVDGKLVKRRGTRESAALAVENTVQGAFVFSAYRAARRAEGEWMPPIAWACQGVDPEQYEGCLRRLLPLVEFGDWVAMGGFCIIGRLRRYVPVFLETCRRVFPLIASAGVRRVHVLGVALVSALRDAAVLAAEHGLELSTDCSGPERSGCAFGKRTCADGVSRPLRDLGEPCRKGQDYHPADLARYNIERVSEICMDLSSIPAPTPCSASPRLRRQPTAGLRGRRTSPSSRSVG